MPLILPTVDEYAAMSALASRRAASQRVSDYLADLSRVRLFLDPNQFTAAEWFDMLPKDPADVIARRRLVLQNSYGLPGFRRAGHNPQRDAA